MSDSLETVHEIPEGTPVRYIKLGYHGGWEPECIRNGTLRVGFGSQNKLALCLNGQWDRVKNAFLMETKSTGTASRFTKELKLLYEDKGSILWITFVGGRLYWGFLAPDLPQPHPDGDGTWRKLRGDWQCRDAKNVELTKDTLSGALTKLAGYRGTSCNVDVATYVIRRINGQTPKQVECAIEALKRTRTCVKEMMTLLLPKDFELLVDLFFSASGWRRQGAVGGTQKTKDFDLVLPIPGDQAFVQVKSNTSPEEFKQYIAKINDFPEGTRMFYVYHSSSGVLETEDESVKAIGPDDLAGLVIDAGLVNWLIRKVS